MLLLVRERNRKSVCSYVCKRERNTVSMCVTERGKEKERTRVRVCECVRVRRGECGIFFSFF